MSIIYISYNYNYIGIVSHSWLRETSCVLDVDLYLLRTPAHDFQCREVLRELLLTKKTGPKKLWALCAQSYLSHFVTDEMLDQPQYIIMATMQVHVPSCVGNLGVVYTRKWL